MRNVLIIVVVLSVCIVALVSWQEYMSVKNGRFDVAVERFDSAPNLNDCVFIFERLAYRGVYSEALAYANQCKALNVDASPIGWLFNLWLSKVYSEIGDQENFEKCLSISRRLAAEKGIDIEERINQLGLE
jgi:hypothetical protein